MELNNSSFYELSYTESAGMNLLFYVAMFAVITLLSLTYLKHQFRDFFGQWKKYSLQILIGIGAIFGASIAVSMIFSLIDFTEVAENQQQWLDILASGPFGVFATVTSSVLLAPIVEEIVFRYAGFELVKKFNVNKKVYPYVVIMITSLMFGAIHIFGDNPLQALFYCSLGAVLGFFYYKSDNIIVPISIHLLWNLFGVMTMILV